jgi:hypothetical protein
MTASNEHSSEHVGLPGSATLAVRPLSIVPEGDEFIVGHAELSVYVVLPAIGVQLLALLREGRTLDDAAEQAGRAAGEEIDVAAFAESLLELGFATGAPMTASSERVRYPRGCAAASHRALGWATRHARWARWR